MAEPCAEYLRSLALGLWIRGLASSARELLEDLVVLVPEDGATWLLLGELRVEAGDYPGAETALARACRWAPKDPKPWLRRAEATPDRERRRRCLAQARRRRPGPALRARIELLEACP